MSSSMGFDTEAVSLAEGRGPCLSHPFFEVVSAHPWGQARRKAGMSA